MIYLKIVCKETSKIMKNKELDNLRSKINKIDDLNQVINHLEKIKYGKLHFVFGTVNDKKLDSILNILPKQGIYYFCKAKIDRALGFDQSHTS